MNIKKELLKSFIIGSSLPSFIILFTAVSYYFIIEKSTTYSYHKYSIAAPLYIGTMSLIAKLINLKLNISLRYSYLLISIVSILYVLSDISGLLDYPSYNFKDEYRWKFQYFKVFIGHLFIYNVIIYSLDSYL